MSPREPEGRRSRHELIEPIGIFLIVSGIVVILVAAFTNAVVAAIGPFLIASGIGLVVAGEYREDADMEYSRLWGLKLKTKKGATTAEDDPSAQSPHPDNAVSNSHRRSSRAAAKPEVHRNRDPTRRPPGCRLAQALNRRTDRSG